LAIDRCRKLNESFEEDGNIERHRRITFDDAKTRFFQDNEGLSEKTIKRDEQYFGNLRAFLELKAPAVLENIRLLTTENCKDYLIWRKKTPKLRNGHYTKPNDKRLKGGSVVTINKELGRFRTWFKELMITWDHIEKNPWMDASRLKISKVDKKKKQVEKQWMTEDDARALILAAKNRDKFQGNRGFRAGFTFHDAILVALKTGMRLADLIILEWDDINFEKGSIHVVGYKEDEDGNDLNSKGSKERFVPMCETLKRTLLERKKSRTSSFVFPYPKDNVSMMDEQYFRKNYQRLTERAGLSKITEIHATRRTFATLARKKGIPMERIQHILGHESIEQTLRDYAFPSEDEGQECIDIIEGLF
jgi:integrase